MGAQLWNMVAVFNILDVMSMQLFNNNYTVLSVPQSPLNKPVYVRRELLTHASFGPRPI